MGWSDEGWVAVLNRWKKAIAKRGDTTVLPEQQPPASEVEVMALERRLGLPLPPSYRSFLLASNGLSIPGEDAPNRPALLPAERVARVTDTYPLWLWLEHTGLGGLFDVEGSVAKHLLDPDEYSCQGHWLYAIKIDGGYPESDLLLDPLDVDADGEWRVWDKYKESSPKYRSFGDLIEARINAIEQPQQPPYYKYVADPSADAQERLTLEAQLQEGGEVSELALGRLVGLATSAGSPQQRAPAVWVLLNSSLPAARDAVLRLIESRPDDPVIVGNALNAGLAREHTDRLHTALLRALLGPKRNHYASSLITLWPELVEEAWEKTKDRDLLHHLLSPKRPWTLQATIDALADPLLAEGTRSMLVYTLGYRAGGFPARLAAIHDLAAIPQNSRFDLARALLAWNDVGGALSLVEGVLESPDGHADYFFMELNERRPPEAIPVLVDSLRRTPTANVLHTLSFFDDPRTVPELARHLDGSLRDYALIGLEQLATTAAFDALAERARAGDIDAARALARARDDRALEPLFGHLDHQHRRSAVTGLRDLRHPRSQRVLLEIAREEADENVAVIAAHGLVMAGSPKAREAAEALRTRDDRHVRKLAEHWLSLLTT